MRIASIWGSIGHSQLLWIARADLVVTWLIADVSIKPPSSKSKSSMQPQSRWTPIIAPSYLLRP